MVADRDMAAKNAGIGMLGAEMNRRLHVMGAAMFEHGLIP